MSEQKKSNFWLELEQKISRHPLVILAAIAVLTVFFLYAIAHYIKVDSDVKNIIPKDNSVKVFFDETSRKFGDLSAVVIALENPKGIYNAETFTKIKEISDELELVDNAIARDRVKKILSSFTPEELNLFLQMMNEKITEFQTFADFEKFLADEGALSEYFSDPGFLKKYKDIGLSKQQELFFSFKKSTDEFGDWTKRVRDVKSILKINYVFSNFSDTKELDAFFNQMKINPNEGITLSNFFLEKNRVEAAAISDYLKTPPYQKQAALLGLSEESIQKLSEIRPEQLKKWSDLIKKSPKQIRVADLFNKENFAENPSRELFLVEERLKSWDLFENMLYSVKNPNMTQISMELVPLTKTEELEVLFPYVNQIVKKKLEGTGMTYYIAGEPVVTEEIGRNIVDNMKLLLPIVIFVFALVLYLTFRHWIGVFLPCMAVLFATIWTFGTLAITGGLVSVMLSVLPVILIAVASGFGVHMIHRYYYLRTTGLDQEESLKKTMEGIGFAVVMSALTVIAGFASMLSNEITSLRDFGLYAAIGVFYALVIALFFIPAMLRFLKLPKKIQDKFDAKAKLEDEEELEKEECHHGKITRMLQKLSNIILHHPKRIWIPFVAATLISIAASPFLVVDLEPIAQFKENSMIKIADRVIKSNFAGTSAFDVVIDTGKPNGILDFEFLNKIEAFQKEMDQEPLVGKSTSISQMVKKMHQTYHYSDPAYYKIPDAIFDSEGKLVSISSPEEKKEKLSAVILSYINQLSLNDTRRFVDTQKQITKISLILKSGSSVDVKKIFKKTDLLKAKYFSENKVESTGGSSIVIELNNLVIKDQILAIFISMLAVLLMMTLMQRSFKMGLIASIPLAMAVCVNFGVMGLTGITLNTGTAIIAAIAIGTGVDYTIHFFNDFNKGLLRSQTKQDSIANSISFLTGERILINVFSVASGFLVLIFSSFETLMHAGILVCLLMITTGFSAISIIPVLVNKMNIKRWGMKKE